MPVLRPIPKPHIRWRQMLQSKRLYVLCSAGCRFADTGKVASLKFSRRFLLYFFGKLVLAAIMVEGESGVLFVIVFVVGYLKVGVGGQFDFWLVSFGK